MAVDLFNTRAQLETSGGAVTIYSLRKLAEAGHGRLERLPYSIRILLEAVLRRCNDKEVTRQDVLNLAGWPARTAVRPSMPFYPGRVVVQDFTGVPLVNDLAAMRSAVADQGGEPEKVNPQIPVDLVIDHSVQVDYYASPEALSKNAELEFQRNHERYEFLHWAQNTFRNFRVVPPSTGIVHQVNLEYLTQVVLARDEDGERVAFPDTLVGTDSHTTMINGLGVVGWGVGGIEAMAAMLGEPIEILTPDVIGFKITGKLPEGTTPTDLALTVIQMLRKKGVVDKFVEFFGPGLAGLSLADRAMIANMSPESGATMIYFPVDEQSLRYLYLTGRAKEQIDLVRDYTRAQALFREEGAPDPEYTDVLELDLATVEPSLAGPKRPQDRVALSQVKDSFQKALAAPKTERGFALTPLDLNRAATVNLHGKDVEIGHGFVAIASITSCTNTSNPFAMLAAGLLAKAAVDKGLKVKPGVKTSLAPGSRVVTEYLEAAGLMEPLAAIGFDVVGYGCTTCIGNAGPLDAEIERAINENGLVVASVLSGNRNFEGRIHPAIQANYLASPPLVVAYALAGSITLDLGTQPLGEDESGQPVYLRDLWPSNQAILDVIAGTVAPEMFEQNYAKVFSGNATWNAIASDDAPIYEWDPASTYLQEPPFFKESKLPGIDEIHGARALAVFGDSITTDHISPAGAIPLKSPAGQYLIEHGVPVSEFNSFGSRRGNDRVMARGTFGNIRIKNLMLPGVEGGTTVHYPDGEKMTIFDAAVKYKAEGTPLVILAGKEYGTGSSRDWAAKGPLLLGVRAVIAESFERIHRSNLVLMGILPLQFLPGESTASLGLKGTEVFHIEGLSDTLKPGDRLNVRAITEDGATISFQAIARLNTPIEINYYRNGGIFNTVLTHLTNPTVTA